MKLIVSRPPSLIKAGFAFPLLKMMLDTYLDTPSFSSNALRRDASSSACHACLYGQCSQKCGCL
jgi:hypothetical protein